MSGDSSSPTRRPATLVVAAAILDDLASPSRILCAQRAYPAHLAGQWELPGGKADPDEDIPAALHREVGEELGVAITLGPLLPGTDERYPDLWPIPSLPDTAMAVYLASLAPAHQDWQPPAQTADHLALQWHSRSTIAALPWLEADIPIAAELARILRND